MLDLIIAAIDFAYVNDIYSSEKTRILAADLVVGFFIKEFQIFAKIVSTQFAEPSRF